jgi:hypothetical protein
MVFSTSVEYKVKKGKRPPHKLKRELQAWQTRTTAKLQVEPPLRQGERVRWTSRKQERYVKGFVLKKDAEGNLIPYQRTGKLAQGWEVFVDYDAIEEMRRFTFQLQVFLASLNPAKKDTSPATPTDSILVSIFNKSDVMRYVEGFQQQGFHRDQGWLFAPEVIGDQVRELDGIMQDTGIL